jgi:hypothetical protein
MPRRALLAAGAVLVAGAVALGLPWLTERRAVVTATPSPPALYLLTPVSLPPGSRACLSPVVVPRHSGLVRFGLHAPPGGAPPLRVVARGGGWSSMGSVAAGHGTGSVTVPLRPPVRDVLAAVCVVNAGRSPVGLDGTIEPRRAITTVDGRRAHVVVDGHRLPAAVALTLQEGAGRSIAARVGDVLDHATAFRPGFVTPGAVAVLMLVLLALAAAGAPWAYARALAGDERRGPTGS